MSAIKTVTSILGDSVRKSFKVLEARDPDALERLVTIIQRPDLNAVYSEKQDVITLRTGYGSIRLNGDAPDTIRNVYVGDQPYSFVLDNIDAIEHLVGSYDDVRMVLDKPQGTRAVGRRFRRTKNRKPEEIPESQIQEAAMDDLARAGITYDNIFRELGGVINGPMVSVNELVTDLYTNNIDEKDIARHLIYDSPYKNEVMSRMYNYQIDEVEKKYDYRRVDATEDSFIGKLVSSLGKEYGDYDEKEGVLRFEERMLGKDIERKIVNLPRVDENGIFYNKETRYIPHYIGYYAEGDGTRVERLRVLDPVERAINGVRLEYDLTTRGDIKFQTVLDVSRGLPDFENHPYGDEILATLKKKVVLGSRYRKSNSLLSEHMGKADALGAVALTMLDDDAQGIIDPYGTSNGKNLGIIFYLTEDAQVNANGTITAGEASFSAVGKIMHEYAADKDNFNRQQMSFNAFLTSLDVEKRKVFISEFGLWNSEDAVVLMNDLGKGYATGDKMEDFHGNKSTISAVISDLTPEEVAERHLEHAVEFARLNPHVDMVTSPASLASRLNMGIIHEGLQGETLDVTLPNGDVVKDGCIELMYMRLPQTAESKSKDYAIEGGGRRYSTLLRYALSSKVGELYKEGLVSQEVHDANVDEAASIFYRLGVSFNNDDDLIKDQNVNMYVSAPVTIDMETFRFARPAAMRLGLMNEMRKGSEDGNIININLGDLEIESRLTGRPVVDERGNNVLPIRIPKGDTIPYRYMDMFSAIAKQNHQDIQREYQKLTEVDYGQLTSKDNVLKNIDTMVFTEGAKTTVIVPDPSIGLGQVRSTSQDTRLIVHRDPAIQSGNAISVENAGGARPNVLHVNPLMINQVDGDFDGDTMGENDYSNLTLSEAQKDEFFAKSSVEEQLNYYGEVFLDIGGAHFKALSKVNGLSTDHITFANGESNREVMEMVEAQTKQLLQSPESYGAYAISFENEETAKHDLFRLADEGIKGNKEEMELRLASGYSKEENRELAKALIAKSEWTGLAGAVTNNLIAEMDENNFEVSRTAFDVTHSMTQSVLQMKKDASRLNEIDGKIKQMKRIMGGDFGVEESRQRLKEVTEGLLPEGAVDKFVNQVAAAQQDPEANFGHGVINENEMTTTKLSYMSTQGFAKALEELGESREIEQGGEL